MAKTRIGELLLQRGAIREEQLRHALHTQLIYGGHLGTCLIEAGYLDEHDLGRALADSHGVGYASCDELRSIPRAILSHVPRRLVEKHKAIPFRLDDGGLHVSLVDPQRRISLEEISFAAGYHVVPWISPEVRIFEAMERHYGIPRSPRFVSLGTILDHTVGSRRSGATAAIGTLAPPSVAMPAPGRAESGGPSAAAADLAAATEQSWWEIAGVVDSPVAHRGPTGGMAEPEPLRELDKLLCQADYPDDVAAAILDDPLVREVAHSILFRVDGTTARIWDWRGIGLPPDSVKTLSFSVTEEPIFELMAGTCDYRGPLADGPHFRWFLREFDLGLPREALLLPLHVEDRLAAVLYADNGTQDPLPRSTEDYRALLDKLKLALRIVSLKHRLRRT